MKQTKFKNQNAITLIALVITILVLLILAGVALSLVVGEDGITNRAITASKTYDIAGAKEQVDLLVASYAGEFYQEKYINENGEATNIADYISSKLNGEKAGDYDITTDGRKVTVSKGDNAATGKIQDAGSITWGKSWEYATEDGKTIITDGTIKLSIGDKVNYNPQTGATKTEYISPKEKSGWDNDQKFKLSSYLYGWRVLGVDESTGQILLISEEFIGPDEGGYYNETYECTYYYLQGKTGYENGITELNNISALYGQGKYAIGARSITVDDINKITGFDPEGDYSGYRDDDIDNYDYGNECTIDGKVYKNTSYYYNVSVLPNIDANAEEVIVGKKTTDGLYYFTNNGSEMKYWLASSWEAGELWGGRYHDAFLGLRKIKKCNIACVQLEYFTDMHEIGEWSSKNDFLGVRPVVYLQSDINLKYNSSTAEWDFVN